VNIDAIEFTASADVNMLLILLGKSEGKPKFGCPFCSASTPYLDDGVLYTLSDLISLHDGYLMNVSVKKTKQKYHNVTNDPLLTRDADTLVLKLLCVPELHLLIGLVGKLISEVEKRVFPTNKKGKAFINTFRLSIIPGCTQP
jgi:hypothetical protein